MSTKSAALSWIRSCVAAVTLAKLDRAQATTDRAAATLALLGRVYA